QAGSCAGDGTCTFAAVANGTSCNDGNNSTKNDVCTNGTCAGTAFTCAAPDQCHAAGVPNGSTCTYAALTNGTSRNDGSACTKNHVSTAGVCGGTSYTCNAADSCHQAGTCNGDGTCSFANKANGTSCNVGCSASDTCTNGMCGGTCAAPDQCHQAGVCT